MDKVLKKEMGQGKFKPDDFLQPDNPKFRKVYGHDPFGETKVKEKQRHKEKGQRKAGLEEKYWRMRKLGELKPWEEKEVRGAVLHEDSALNDNLQESLKEARKRNG